MDKFFKSSTDFANVFTTIGLNDFRAVKEKKIDIVEKGEKNVFFDLASVTKPLTNSLSYFLSPQSFTAEMLLCLNHRGGLPSWGLLPRKGWKEQILNYSVKQSETLYSDFSALRVMLELEKRGFDQKKNCSKIWDNDTVFWLDLPSEAKTVQTGFKNGEKNFGKVHDPNAWTIASFCSHAGLFSTAVGLCRTLLNYEEQTHFINLVKNDLRTHNDRFSYGWDRVVNPKESLAGKGCGPLSFGHLGFTGTSIWIDPDKMIGHVILTNAVKNYWYDKKVLNELRRAIGENIWSR